ncbi:hypothetical protein GOODEAATRI_031157 [Goodea atripinnis]|uniref:Uncharacterized protein n=1 Tax=Goodea atripinnis TaxID=208336 RepID=A0ABV0MNE8_9TELE
MPRRKTRRKAGNAKLSRDDDEQLDLTVSELELTEVLETAHVYEKMSELEAVLREIREFRRKTAKSFNDIKEDLGKRNRRIDEAERRIEDTEERVQSVEEVACELIKLQRQLQEKQTDQERSARRVDIRLHGVKDIYAYIFMSLNIHIYIGAFETSVCSYLVLYEVFIRETAWGKKLSLWRLVLVNSAL